MNDRAGFLVIDKPQTWTSHDVVAKTRGILKIRKIGHLGTLDPIATGVLVLAVNRAATKRVEELMGADKAYEVEMELGKSSDTYDADGMIQVHALASIPSDDAIIAAVESFWGESEQMPPAFSAKKVNGQRAYKLARAGKEVKLSPKIVRMEGGDIEIDWPFVRFTVEVSSGTYVRSLVHDIGQALGTGAVMTALRRTRVGSFTLEQAHRIEELEADVELIPVDMV